MAMRLKVEQSINLLIERLIDTDENELEFTQNTAIDSKKYKQKVAQLDELSRKVLIEKGTEPPVFNDFNNNTQSGKYNCKLCGQLLFSSKDKYNSGTGWPSFTRPFVTHSVIYDLDKELRIPRVEVKCSNCKSHLGHVFDDGPAETNLRYCMNSAAMTFSSDK